MAGIAVSLIGLSPHAATSAATTGELRIFKLLLPAAAFAASAWLMPGYSVTAALHRTIRTAIDPVIEVGQ